MTTDTVSERINRLFAQENWAAARRLIRQELKEVPDNDHIRHWWLTRLSATYYEERSYRLAAQWAKQAEAIAPNCPLVLWDLAGALDMLNDESGAIRIYERLVARGVKAVAEDDCGEGLGWAKGLINDCQYRLALCHEAKGDDTKASHHLERFMDGLARGSVGIYGGQDATTVFSRILKRQSLNVNSFDVTTFEVDVKSLVFKVSFPSSPPKATTRFSVAGLTLEEVPSYTPGFRLARASGWCTSTTQLPQSAGGAVPAPA